MHNLGVCINPDREPYKVQGVQQVIADVKAVGGSRVRMRSTAGNLSWVSALKAAGIHVTTICWTVGEADASFAAGVDRIELINEANLALGATEWIPRIRSDSATIYAKYGGKIEIMAASLGRKTGFEDLGMITQTDRGNIHMYPGGDALRNPDGSIKIPGWEGRLVALDRVSKLNRLNSGFKPTSHTETGFHNGLQVLATEGHRPTTEAQAAERIGGWLDECFKRSDEVYIYCLYNLGTNQADREDNFGLWRVDHSEKPVVEALRKWVAAQNPAPAPVPEPTHVVTSSTPWAVAITPDPTDRWKTVQTHVGVEADGLVGNGTLTGIENALVSGKNTANELALAQAQLDSAVDDLEAADVTIANVAGELEDIASRLRA